MMIDGIDVSKCKFYYDEICDDCYEPIDIPYCKDNNDCYYKQLKRKEQECEELKKTIEYERRCKEDYQDKWRELYDENEILQKQYNCYACGNCKGKEDYKNLEKHHIGLRKQFDKYNQALDEIEEVCKKDMKDKDRYDKMFGCYIAKTILQIIQKVKEQ